MATKAKGTGLGGSNPRNKEALKAAGMDDDDEPTTPDPKKGVDKGNLPSPEGFQMSQGQFSGYPQTKTKK